MLLIVLHHFSVHSPWPTGSMFSDIIVSMLSFGGKIGVDCFILITGYFMIGSKFRLRSILRVIAETYLYSVLILIIFLLFNRELVYFSVAARSLLPVSSGLYWFITVYVAMYFLSPFLNRLFNALGESGQNKAIVIGFIIFSVIPTISTYNPIASNLIWFCYLYMLGGYIRLRLDKDRMHSLDVFSFFNPAFLMTKIGPLVGFLIAVCFIFLSMIFITLVNVKFGITDPRPRYFIEQNTVPVLFASVSLFLLFKNLQMKNIQYINTIAGTTLGVYLIHDNPFVRNWLWDCFVPIYYEGWFAILIFSLVITVIVFTLCSFIDWMRIKCIEKPVFNLLDKKTPDQIDRFDKVMNSFAE